MGYLIIIALFLLSILLVLLSISFLVFPNRYYQNWLKKQSQLPPSPLIDYAWKITITPILQNPVIFKINLIVSAIIALAIGLFLFIAIIAGFIKAISIK